MINRRGFLASCAGLLMAAPMSKSPAGPIASDHLRGLADASIPSEAKVLVDGWVEGRKNLKPMGTFTFPAGSKFVINPGWEGK